MGGQEERGRRPPPALPPGQSSAVGPSEAEPEEAPPPYELVAHQQRALEKATADNPSASGTALGHNDPRSSSQQSLAPEPGEQNERRRLLLIYIHGFMGNETSFRSFPAHLHNLLAVLLEQTHVIHTKIYPRYRSKGHISNARNDFSKWLEPHESPSTDVVLLGHSMGGLLSAEVVLMPSSRPSSQPLNHRIVGTINFDVPFLGMHPGVVKSGLASIFKGSEEPPGDRWEDQLQDPKENEGPSQPQRPTTPASRLDTFWDKADPNFNPKFTNDVILPVRKGWKNALHFVNKHSDDLIKSTKKLISSHMEFGGAMANYGELKTRYSRVRALEVEDGRIRQTVVEGGVPPRVHFVNYYTASTGRPRKPSSSHQRLSPSPHGSRSPSRESGSRASIRSKRQSKDGSLHPEDAIGCVAVPEGSSSTVEAEREEQNSGKGPQDGQLRPTASDQADHPPTATELPVAPPPLGDLSYIQDENLRKLVEDNHKKAVERYEKALKQREPIPKVEAKPREEPKVEEQPESKPEPKPAQKPESEMTHMEKEALRLEKEKQRMEAEARRMRGEKDPPAESKPEPAPAPVRPSASVRPSIDSTPRVESRTESYAASTVGTASTYGSSLLTPQESRDIEPAKPKKDRKFCTLPPKDANGERDPCWVRVFMKDVDEVGAHCGLFFVDERYERLVGDVAERIERWVNEESGFRASRAPRAEKS
ncbi:hypothetical protein M409DRAFT_17290 [Zasmidium cellare ATCC 36951]|uniref:DUF676 domain-containing protein n=1 Tax=Zasmidium cellare ATCC 36951 TaxID=1080233 RepID=A0A6A6D1W5_ZASCE|nr:uncharacterized protein M409DRAFT_17290 [Zasmidium cellare ATCC 36951]KAF2173351.1 hypothetical protein M409DRAFT_17290 [Zasmidium cellare ATCC 36951]